MMSPGHSCIAVRRFLSLQEVWLREPSLLRYLLCFTSVLHFFKNVFPVFFCEEKTDGKSREVNF